MSEIKNLTTSEIAELIIKKSSINMREMDITDEKNLINYLFERLEAIYNLAYELKRRYL